MIKQLITATTYVGINKGCKYHKKYIDDLKKQNEEYKKEESDILAELDML